ncbi:MAG TPA: hypothetical protein VI756_03345 [Blastocatellia bacterium]
MKPASALIVVMIASIAIGCGDANKASGQATTSKPGRLNYPPYTGDDQKMIKMLNPTGDWIPVLMKRNLIILREHGIRLDRGDYFVKFLADSGGNINKFILAKNRNVKVSDIDFPNAKAPDGSFAEVLDFVAVVKFYDPFDQTLAYTSSSGESESIWVHLAHENVERRGELFGLENLH